MIIDFLSKYWIEKNFSLYEFKPINSILNIFYVRNYGAAFSILSYKNGWQKWCISFISIITIVFIITMIKKNKKKYLINITAYSFILGGAIGNLLNRIIYGFIIDFIDIHFYNHHFAIFNIADLSIFLGIIIMIKIYYSHHENK